LNSIHLEETAFSNIFEEQHELNTNNDETSLYQGLDYTLMDSMNISCDLNPTILGSPRGSEYVRAAEETTRSLLNELDELKKTKQTLERSIKEIRVRLTPKKSPKKKLSLSPNPNKSLPLSPKNETLINVNIATSSNTISFQRKALSPIPISISKVNKKTNKNNNQGLRRKTISIDLNENIENVNPNEITQINNNINQKNDDSNNKLVISENNENKTALCITKIKPTTSIRKAVVKKVSSRLKVSKIDISNLFE
jgi:hypothetical protein